MDVLLIVINVLLVLTAIVVIVSVLMQDGARSGLGAIGGGAETFFGKSKAKTYEKKLELITKIGVTSFILLAIAMTAINARTGISNLSTTDLSSAPSVSELLDQKKAVSGEGLDTSLPETVEPEATVEPAAEEPEATAAPEATVEPVVTAAPTAQPAAETPAPTAQPEVTAAPTAEPVAEEPAATVAPAA